MKNLLTSLIRTPTRKYGQVRRHRCTASDVERNTGAMTWQQVRRRLFYKRMKVDWSTQFRESSTAHVSNTQPTRSHTRCPFSSLIARVQIAALIQSMLILCLNFPGNKLNCRAASFHRRMIARRIPSVARQQKKPVRVNREGKSMHDVMQDVCVARNNRSGGL